MPSMHPRLPRWLRLTVILGVGVAALAGGLLAWRVATQPLVLRVAAGSIDGEATRLMEALASQLAARAAPVRLRVVDTGNPVDAAKALQAGTVELAVVRADAEDVPGAQAIVVLTHAVVML